MKIKNLFLAASLLVLSPSLWAQESNPTIYKGIEYRDDSKILDRISSAAEKIIAEGNYLSPGEAHTQLFETANKKISLQTARSGKKELSAKEIFARTKKATLVFGTAFHCGKCDQTHVSHASGYVIDESGICVTNHHVIEGYTKNPENNRSLQVMTANGKVYPVVEVLSSSPENDLAIVRIDIGNDRLHALSLGQPAAPGADVYVLSHPNSMYYYFAEGMVSRNFSRKGRVQMSITADFAAGSSGGPVVDKFGNVVGTISNTQSIYYKPKEQEGLQMVVKNTVPVMVLKKLLDGER